MKAGRIIAASRPGRRLSVIGTHTSTLGETWKEMGITKKMFPPRKPTVSSAIPLFMRVRGAPGTAWEACGAGICAPEAPSPVRPGKVCPRASRGSAPPVCHGYLLRRPGFAQDLEARKSDESGRNGRRAGRCRSATKLILERRRVSAPLPRSLNNPDPDGRGPNWLVPERALIQACRQPSPDGKGACYRRPVGIVAACLGPSRAA